MRASARELLVPFLRPLVWRGRGANPRPTAPEADALTTRLSGPTNDLCCKKAFQTNVIEIKYNYAKRYHILWTNCAKGIVFGLLTVLNVTIFLLIYRCHFPSSITR